MQLFRECNKSFAFFLNVRRALILRTYNYTHPLIHLLPDGTALLLIAKEIVKSRGNCVYSVIHIAFRICEVTNLFIFIS
jgi:hypothetical protein